MIAAGLFSRCLELFASVVTLLERGLANPVRALLRSFLEATIRLGAVAADDEFWQKFILEDELNSRTVINVVRKSNAPHFAELKKWATDERLDEIKQATHNIKKMSLEEIAKKAGMTQFYDTMYRTLSAPVHTGARELLRHLVVNAAGKVEAVSFKPNDRETAVLAATSATILCNAVTKFSEAIGVKLPDDVKGRALPAKERLDQLISDADVELPEPP